MLPDGDRFHVAPARVTLQGPWITAVDPLGPQHAGEPADDLGDRLLTPAFIDAHTHLALGGLRGALTPASTAHNVVEDLFFHFEAKLRPEDVRALVRVGAHECLLHGTASVWDHYYHADAVASGLVDAGLAGVVAPALQDLSGPGMSQLEASLDTTLDLAANRALHAHGVFAALGPHAPDTVSDALWLRIAGLASEHELPIHCHLSQSGDEVLRLMQRGGLTPAAHLHRLGVLDAGPSWLLVHGVYLTQAELRLLDAARHTLVFCPSSQAIFAFHADVAAWQAAGLPWIVATDCAASNDALSVQHELRAVIGARPTPSPFLLQRWRAQPTEADARALIAHRDARFAARSALGDPTALLHRVWTLPGRLHPAAPAGAIAPGHLAHLALWDTSHPAFWPGADPLRALAYGSPTPALEQLMVAGAWRTPRGQHADLARSATWREAAAEARARLTDLGVG